MPPTGSKISVAANLPKIRSDSGSIISPPSITAFTLRPSLLPQSSSIIVQSCATSTSLRVKYPELAVLSAVSARPFLAPCEELKYSKTVSPSLKFEIIGVSIISPEGFAIRPLIPASCFIWAADPRAPESAIINTEFIFFSSETEDISPIISSATWSVHSDQTSTTLLYFSPWVIRPSRYCCSYSFTFACAEATSVSFALGIIRSSFPKEIPDRQAFLKPRAITRSAKRTVDF